MSVRKNTLPLLASLILMMASAGAIAAGPAKAKGTVVPQGEVKKGVYYEVINFMPASADISETAKGNLKKIVESARKHGDVEEVHIAAFADAPFPAHKKALGKTEQGIANRRGEMVKSYLEKTLNVSDVDVYDMSVQSNWLAKAFNTKDAEVKALFEPGNDTPINHDELVAVKAHGGPSKAVVIVTLDDDAKEHSQTAPSSTPTNSSKGH